MSSHTPNSAPRRLPGFLRRSMRTEMMEEFDMPLGSNNNHNNSNYSNTNNNNSEDTIIRMDPSSSSPSLEMRSSSSQLQSQSLSPSDGRNRSTLTSLIQPSSSSSSSSVKKKQEEEEQGDGKDDIKDDINDDINDDDDRNQVGVKFRFMKSPFTNLSPTPSMDIHNSTSNDMIGNAKQQYNSTGNGMDSTESSEGINVNVNTKSGDATGGPQMTGQKGDDYGHEESNHENYHVTNSNNFDMSEHLKNPIKDEMSGTSHNNTPAKSFSSFSSSAKNTNVTTTKNTPTPSTNIMNSTNNHKDAQTAVNASTSNGTTASSSSSNLTSRSRTFTNEDQDELNTSASAIGTSSLTDTPTTSTTTTTNSNHSSSNNTPSKPSKRGSMNYKETEFEKAITDPVVNIAALRKLGWNGIPPQHRPQAWKILLGYLPTNSARRPQTLKRKRQEYLDIIAQHYDISDDTRTNSEQETLRQVLVDVPRTAPDVPLFRNDLVRQSLSRLLYLWACRHPASGYVQGINDLATPLIAVFLSEFYDNQQQFFKDDSKKGGKGKKKNGGSGKGSDSSPNDDMNVKSESFHEGSVLDGSVMDDLSLEDLKNVEADVYWCLTNLLAGIQDHYTSDQPGVQRMVMRLEDLVNRMDGELTHHLREVGVEFIQFAFRWMNCLLLREFKLECVIRLWDTYLSEGDGAGFAMGFETFHVYVCAAFLCQFSGLLKTMEFDELFGFMQNVPTSDWGDGEVEILLSQAFVLSTLFHGSNAHLSGVHHGMLY